jgi:hypothetical protein
MQRICISSINPLRVHRRSGLVPNQCLQESKVERPPLEPLSRGPLLKLLPISAQLSHLQFEEQRTTRAKISGSGAKFLL